MPRTVTLPTPLADAWDWQRLAACRGKESSVFFHPEYERGQARRRRVAQAKSICQSCPVLSQCREHALRVGEPYGTWGGLSETERREMGVVRGFVR
jgi:WhiB family redox-sensing transcriptional regulator